MAIFKFHVLNDSFYAVDEVGTELADQSAVDRHARQIISDLISDDIRERKEPVHLSIMVDDKDGFRVGSYRSVTTVVTSFSPF